MFLPTAINGAFLADLGFIDFAGSSIVHSVGAWAGLVGAMLLGPRIGKFVDGKPQAMPGHNMAIATLGALILWIGWYGFNPGSQLAMDQWVPYVAVTTTLAAAGGGILTDVPSRTKGPCVGPVEIVHPTLWQELQNGIIDIHTIVDSEWMIVVSR